MLNPHASARVGHEGWMLAIRAGGSGRLVERYGRDLVGARMLEGGAESAFWRAIEEFTPAFLAEKPAGNVVRVSVPLAQVGAVLEQSPVPTVARAGNGVCQAHFGDLAGAGHWLAEAERRGWRGVVEFHGSEGGTPDQAWPQPGPDLAVMRRIKDMLDPEHLLNRGRLHGRI
jgi:FAD/FMN-containing dehydrogenase